MIRVATLALLLATAPAMAAKYNFDYAMAGADSVGLVRTFDDGKNTVLAFEGPVELTKPTITTVDGTILHYKSISRYAVLPGLQRQVLVYTKGLVAQVRYAPDAPRTFSPTVMPLAAAAGANPPRPVVAAAAAPVFVPLPPRAAPTTAPAASTPAIAPAKVERAASTTDPAPAPVAPAEKAESKPSITVHVEDAPPAVLKPEWIASSDTTLRGAIEAWSKKAGWTVVWDAGIDYPIAGTLRYEGQYLDAIRGIFKAHAHADQPLQVDAYTRQQLIHITE